MNFYQFARGVVASVFFPLYRIEVKGKEHFPKEGAVLLCSNHIDNLDPPTVGISAPRQVHFMAKEELFRVPVLGGIVRKVGSFPVKRGMSDREALRNGLNVLKDGGVLGLFPEGTRSKDGQLGKGLAGAGFFALRSNALVVPCAVIGTYKPFNKVKVFFGEPINLDPLRERKATAEEATELIMSKIAELLEKHRS
ncbi:MULTISPECIES: lysophospholipid acyltransferase family protein [Metabacillus]|uniref:Lysophospholipid acyltransferase family protein n=1 Tax=Metabacillus hrfriensis TaxID=3048891 RepID=A0ACD4RIS9_9BACI|nr:MULTISPECIES: lysophospholipid acyltransferase family protein [Metabacillus]UAL54791.1 1-acyl-sn-glycerol-3-phosphate acyltransferase [Metabacillus dongyingensis]USK31074.1 1-acyl-sn-glycerol-3-phosphate acyltransferase [Bacillus sp. CMF21]WHZ60297.1 lysophospholipid acyltransferase family protein [Metabacillus sp. CT-WN-B3]